MKPIDYRNEKFEQLQGRMEGLRRAVFEAWRRHGPGTTREVAQRAGIDLLSFRPRTTELYEMGALCIAEGWQERKGEGVYRARLLWEWEEWWARQRTGAVDGQLKMAI